MRTLTWDEIEDLLLGATVLGCGGGGDLSEGRELLRRVYDEGRAVTLAAPEDLAPDTLLATVYGVGGLTVGEEAVYAGLERPDEEPGVLAVRALAAHLDAEFGALMTGELGGTSIADAFVPAAMLGVPVVDADPVGRAVPELEHSLFYLSGVPIAPQAVVNEIGDTAIITVAASDHRAEAMVRALAVASRNLVWVADHAQPWSRLRDVVIQGALTQAQRVGAALRAARASGGDPAAAVAAATGGGVLFRGRVDSCEWEERDGFTWGETRLAGSGDDEGAVFRIWFKNENLLAWRDDLPVATSPDLIALLHDDTIEPITNPHARRGMGVTVVGIPAPEAWRCAAGVALFGPRAFGFDMEFIPLK